MKDADSPSPLLSIIIPTRNRAKYAISAVRSILSNPSPQIELVVQDNSDSDELKTHLASSVADSRLRYSYLPRPLPVIENFHRAADLATGTFVTFIGDDDTVNPEIVDAAHFARAQGFDSLVATRGIQYYWPEFRRLYYGQRFAATLEIKRFTGKLTRQLPDKGIRQCARSGGTSFDGLPKIYYGMVRRRCLQSVKAETGSYFPGPSPDMSGAVAVSKYVQHMCYVDYPIFIPGCCSASTANAASRAAWVTQLENNPLLSPEHIQNWSHIVPPFSAGASVISQGFVQALTATGRADVLQQFNIPLIHAMCAVHYPEFFRKTIKNFYRTVRDQNRSRATSTLKFAGDYIYVWGCRVPWALENIRRALSCNWGTRTIREIHDSVQAARALSEHLTAINRRFGDRL